MVTEGNKEGGDGRRRQEAQTEQCGIMSGSMGQDESAHQRTAGGCEMIDSAAHGNNERTRHFHSV